MTTILDYCVPSRRRERQERKEQHAIASRVNSRWGDAQITAPSEGGWNQLGSHGEQEKDLPVLPFINGSPANSGSSVNTTPDLSILYDKAIEAGITIEHRPEVVHLPQTKEERKNVSFTITLPWPSRRGNGPPTEFTQPTNSPPPRSDLGWTASRPSTAHSPPPPSQMPASDRYMKDLATTGKSQAFMNPLAQSPPDRAVETFPVWSYATESESYAKDVADLGLVPSPPVYNGPSPLQHAAIDPVFIRGRSPPLQHTSPIMRLEPIPATPYCVDNFSDDLHTERPGAVIPLHPAVAERRSRARSSSRGPHSERYARMRSSSRGPAEDRSVAMRPSSRAGAEDGVSAMRSASRGPAEDRIRSSSRGPTRDFVGAPRSSSRGPPAGRTSRQRSTSVGPPAGRIAMVRSASREPTAERIVYSRASRRDSFSSDGSSATMFSDDLDDNKVIKHQRAPSRSIPSPNGVGHLGDSKNGNAPSGGPGGYYSSLASEYRQIAKDVEIQVLSETDSSEGKEHKKKKKKDKLKDRLKEIYQEPQTLVPNATDLYG